ncbi:hypothetical protein MSM1_09005 [Mycobacterium sp. SM1]|uniref:group II intron maturase-specific domain-containing protein n=1 Tax=Mycobacterium sp. SM1 TaxID=2816243 RepID=UPI001BCECBE0|nr:group II intron maturase-specific domain-containing protein [Mycobacterium sp. SM1]MBS4728470.1 hypothetical protein [Mycobacterium sp. SM1]
MNPILRGWDNYFRTGNAANNFRQIDWHVVHRLFRLMVKKRGRNLVLVKPRSGLSSGSTATASTVSAALSATQRLRNHV